MYNQKLNEDALRYIARREHYTKDREFNKGKDDIIKGNIYTDEAQYFLQCLNIQ